MKLQWSCWLPSVLPSEHTISITRVGRVTGNKLILGPNCSSLNMDTVAKIKVDWQVCELSHLQY